MNETSLWFAKRLKLKEGQEEAPLMNYMRRAIMSDLPYSANGGMTDDHIQSFLEKMVRRNALHKLIAKDGDDGIPFSKIALYLRRSAYNDIRHQGKNPILREFYGFRTESEKTHTFESKATGDENREFTKVQILKSRGLVQADNHDPHVVHEQALLFSQMESIIQNRFPSDADHLIRILRLKADGYNFTEISDLTGRSVVGVKGSMSELKSLISGFLGTEGRKFTIVDGTVRVPLNGTWEQTCVSCPRSVYSEDEAKLHFGFRTFWKNDIKVKQQPFTRCKKCRAAVEKGLAQCQ